MAARSVLQGQVAVSPLARMTFPFFVGLSPQSLLHLLMVDVNFSRPLHILTHCTVDRLRGVLRRSSSS